MSHLIHIAPRKPWFIIADDLTGALDAIGPFADRGARCCVASDLEFLKPECFEQNDVVGVSTRSRESPTAHAAQRVVQALHLCPTGWTVVKKIDSRLKGNITTELNALGQDRLIVMPAIPEIGRVVRGGAVCDFGVDHPIYVASRLGGVTAECYIPDTITQEDIARVLDRWQGDGVLVGARGLTLALAQRCFGDARARVRLDHPVTALIGSHDPITTKQIDACLSRGIARLTWPVGHGCLPKGKPGIIQMVMSPPDLSRLPEFAAYAVAQAGNSASYILSGGSTAEAVLDAMGVHHLQVIGECSAGLPLSIADGVKIVTKSGGFGKEQTVLNLLLRGVE